MDDHCTIYRTADFIGRRWTLLVLLELYREGSVPKRYSEIKNSLPGITPKILALRLRELEKEGLVKKKIDSSKFPVACHYSLSPSGEEFISVIQDIKKWALKWKITNKQCKNSDCANCCL